MKKNINTDLYLNLFLKHAPASWALIRAIEIRALRDVNFSSPSLDVGCGDGYVAKIVLKDKNKVFDWGIDLSPIEISKAKKSNAYKKCKVASVYELPFKNSSFKTVFSNSVIEHIPNLDLALSEISRVLKKDGNLIITVPTPYLTKYLWGKNLFESIGLSFVGNFYASVFNNIFKHHNLYTHSEWEKIMKKHSLILVDYKYYHSKKIIHWHELLTLISVPQQISKLLFNNWTPFSRIREFYLKPIRPMLNKLYLQEPSTKFGGSVMLIAKKA